MKTFPHIIQAVYFQPWAITREAWHSIEKIVAKHIAGNAEIPTFDPSAEAAFDLFGQELPQLEMKNGVAYIPINGPMLKGAGVVEKMCGACSHEDIMSNIKVATSMGAEAFVFNIDSPGGTVMGTKELANAIKSINKPTIAMTDGLCCSAAYWTAAACDHIVSTPSAIVGSIGVIMEMLDASAAYSAQGLKVEQFTSGTLKGAGNPAVPLSDSQRQHFQAMVDKMGAEFRAWVTDNRGEVAPSMMQGQGMSGEDGKTCCLVDELVNDIEEFKITLDNNI